MDEHREEREELGAVIEQLRVLGLPMTSRYEPVTLDTKDEETGEVVTTTTQRYICWTTDEAKATAAEELGAQLRVYTSTDARFSGWEVNASVFL